MYQRPPRKPAGADVAKKNNSFKKTAPLVSANGAVCLLKGAAFDCAKIAHVFFAEPKRGPIMQPVQTIAPPVYPLAGVNHPPAKMANPEALFNPNGFYLDHFRAFPLRKLKLVPNRILSIAKPGHRWLRARSDQGNPGKKKAGSHRYIEECKFLRSFFANQVFNPIGRPRAGQIFSAKPKVKIRARNP